MNHTAYDRATFEMRKHLNHVFSSLNGGNYALALEIGPLEVLLFIY